MGKIGIGDIISVMKLIADDIKNGLCSNIVTYNQQRALINRVFQMDKCDKYDKGSIMLRLTVIDSLYSTNALYSYFAIEEMANSIFDLGTEVEVKKHFDALSNLDCDDVAKDVFNKKYGIRKNLADGNKQPSLMSKYAYYQLLQEPQKYPLGFPIYDRLALKMFPIVSDALGIAIENNVTIVANDDVPNICHYIKALDQLRKGIFKNHKNFEGLQQFDILDAYLWRMGKIDEGNFSLLLSEGDYKQFVNNLELSPDFKTDGNNSKTFNKMVREKCRDNDITTITKGLTQNEYISALIEHWRKLVASRTKK